MKTRNQTFQEIWSTRRATRSQGVLETASPKAKKRRAEKKPEAAVATRRSPRSAGYSKGTSNKTRGPQRKRARKGGKKALKEPGIMRDLRTALKWMQSNQRRFRGQVTEPSVLQMDEEDRREALKTALEADYPEAKDPFLFVFQLREDMDMFVDACADQQGLQICCMFLETVI